MNKSTQNKIAAVNKVTELIKTNDANNYQRLLAASAGAHLDNMSLSKAVKAYVDSAAKFLKPEQLKIVTFKSILDAIKADDLLKEQEYFTFFEIVKVANRILKANDANIKRALKAERQNKAAAKK